MDLYDRTVALIGLAIVAYIWWLTYLATGWAAFGVPLIRPVIEPWTLTNTDP